MVADADTHDAVQELHAKQAKRARWSKIGGALLALAFAVRFGAYLLTPAAAQACDATEIRSSLAELVNEAAVKGGTTAKVTSIDHFQTVADDDKLRRCTSHVVMSDKSDGTLTYHVDPKQVMIDSLK